MSAGRRVRSLRTSRARTGGPPAPDDPPEVDVAVVLDLLESACAAGASVTHALTAVGTAVAGARGEALCRAGRAVALGSGWDAAWQDVPACLAPVGRALRASWEEGAAPGGALRSAAAELRRRRHAQALEAAARLGVRLVVPMGLCHLPAFVLVGLAPVLLSMATGVLRG